MVMFLKVVVKVERQVGPGRTKPTAKALHRFHQRVNWVCQNRSEMAHGFPRLGKAKPIARGNAKQTTLYIKTNST